ncbi:hypothetical protein J2X69_003059 [Algoriphagus sp. 4150]|uniref:hypothetical protein n=1 Tax=Algoriphagus sp. 4150 TaxID=2817756 RepID=UPI002860B2FB|nr:hypothetical protein [Algoriphagus sp. 4150]MDR7130702.1 hypothetical protein [Algoriphagus sp. 4150]
MNTEIYDYVKSTCLLIKNKIDYEDVIQEVMIVLIEQNKHNDQLTTILKNYIKGIVWNCSTRIYNQFNKDMDCNIKSFDHLIDDCDSERFYLEDTTEYKRLITDIRSYVFTNYFIKRKHLNRWRTFYLRLKGYNSKYIGTRLNITQQSATEYYYLCVKEIKEYLNFNIEL